MAFEITQQDKALLNLVALHEAKSYDTIYGGREIPLTQMLIAEVLEYQRTQMNSGSTAVGRYQMLRAVVEENCRNLNMDPTQVRLTEDVQDIMMIDKITRYRKYREFKAGSLGATPFENAQKFCVYVAAEWASCPVPYDMPAGSSPFSSRHPRRSLSKGQSFYAGDGLNRAHHDADTFVAALLDIYNGGTGEVTTIPSVPAGGGTPTPSATAPAGSTGYPQAGQSQQSQITNFASGGARYAGGTGNSNTALQGLPAANAPYLYEIIDPLDDRYDFRTGKKISRLLENGTTSVAANAPNTVNTPASDFGVAPNTNGVNPATFTDSQLQEQLNGRDAAATQPGRYSDAPQPANGANSTPITQPGGAGVPAGAGTGTAGSSSNVYRTPSNDGLTGTLAPIKRIPNPLVTDPVTGAPLGLGRSGIGNLKSPYQSIGPNTRNATKPGLNQPPVIEPENSDESFKETIADDLQIDLDNLKEEIADLITQLTEIYQDQPARYATELEDRLDDLEFELEDASESQAFAIQGEIDVIQRKLDLGSPYGLNVNAAQRRAREDTEYQTILGELQTLISVNLSQIISKANSLKIDLIGSVHSANLQSVPPTVKFTNN